MSAGLHYKGMATSTSILDQASIWRRLNSLSN
jgi:hypothetical protein